MKWYSTVSENADIEKAFKECTSDLQKESSDLIDLVIAFVGSDFQESYDLLPQLITEKFPGAVFLGCSGNGIIGNGKEVEHKPGFALCFASMPEVTISPFHLLDSDLPDGDDSPDKWEKVVGVEASSHPDFIILADPFSMRGQNLVNGLDYAYPGSTIIGGISSGGRQPGTNALYLDNQFVTEGTVGVSLSGNVQIDTVVAQGCKPIGNLMRVTKCDRNILEELDGKKPFDILGELYSGLSEKDISLFQNSLFLGVVMDPFEDNPGIGDFLIRNVIGADQERGIISVGEMLSEGQIVQFHLRDSKTSIENLEEMLDDYNTQEIEEGSGALLFSCLGRGSYLYGTPDHDTDLFKSKVGPIPLTGFFCNGEIGPVGDTTYIHGYTSAFGIVRPSEK
jgi:small ligand-binding sensory domain FIST